MTSLTSETVFPCVAIPCARWSWPRSMPGSGPTYIDLSRPRLGRFKAKCGERLALHLAGICLLWPEFERYGTRWWPTSAGFDRLCASSTEFGLIWTWLGFDQIRSSSTENGSIWANFVEPISQCCGVSAKGRPSHIDDGEGLRFAARGADSLLRQPAGRLRSAGVTAVDVCSAADDVRRAGCTAGASLGMRLSLLRLSSWVCPKG